MERWGVFSVIDHANPIMVATELLLYDKLVVPTPMARKGADWDRQSPDWKRWECKKWQPEKLAELIDQLQKHNLVVEAEWDLDRQKNWQQAYSEAKADIDTVNVGLQSGFDERMAAAHVNAAALRPEDRDAAVRAAAYNETRNEIIRNLRGYMNEKVNIFGGPVEFYAAYQSRHDFEQQHSEEDALRGDVERVNFLIQHRLAIPVAPPDQLIKLVTDRCAANPTFKERRRQFYDWQIELLKGGVKPELVVKELNQLVRAFNAQAKAHNQKFRWETVTTVMAVGGAFAAFVPGAAPVAALNTAGIAIWRRHLAKKEIDAPNRIAAPGAMFHQSKKDIGFEYRTFEPSNRPLRI